MKKKGFTLVELLAVIVILGILLVIAIPSFSNVIGKYKKKLYISNALLYIEQAKKQVILDEKNDEYIYYKLSKLGDSNLISPFNKKISDDSIIIGKLVNGKYKYYILLLDQGGNCVGEINEKSENRLVSEEDLLKGKIKLVTNNNSLKIISSGESVNYKLDDIEDIEDIYVNINSSEKISKVVKHYYKGNEINISIGEENVRAIVISQDGNKLTVSYIPQEEEIDNNGDYYYNPFISFRLVANRVNEIIENKENNSEIVKLDELIKSEKITCTCNIGSRGIQIVSSTKCDILTEETKNGFDDLYDKYGRIWMEYNGCYYNYDKNRSDKVTENYGVLDDDLSAKLLVNATIDIGGYNNE